jgi:N6-L-threonylcarbamoyladenine synthase
LSNVVSSSLERHQPYGGVVPEIASRHCLEAIDVVFREALTRAGVAAKDIELIAVTQGPGLIGSILVGVSFAKALSFGRRIPLVGVNHLEAHLDANFIEAGKPKSPFVGLLVSGGHTALVLREKGNYRLLGETVDDAVGEAYDKVAKLLGLGYPGGPVIDRLAALGNPKAVAFTKPKIKNRLNFSFSGIKTAVYYYVDKKKTLTETERDDLCASFQEAVVGWLVEKTMAACDETGAGIIVTGGGVTANSLLRRRLAEEARERRIKVFIPPLKYTTDNAAMIARNGIEKYRRLAGIDSEKPRSAARRPDGVFDIVADPNLAIAV